MTVSALQSVPRHLYKYGNVCAYMIRKYIVAVWNILMKKKKHMVIFSLHTFSTLRTFNAYLGPSGGLRGYQGITGHVSSGLAWYINGYMTPELYLKRGLTYAFKVYSLSK